MAKDDRRHLQKHRGWRYTISNIYAGCFHHTLNLCLQEPEAEMCASMLDAINKCFQGAQKDNNMRVVEVRWKESKTTVRRSVMNLNLVIFDRLEKVDILSISVQTLERNRLYHVSCIASYQDTQASHSHQDVVPNNIAAINPNKWNSSPVRMAKDDRRHLQKHRGWRENKPKGCFPLLRSVQMKAQFDASFSTSAQFKKQPEISGRVNVRYCNAPARLRYFSNVSAYCQELKVLADQLSDVEAGDFHDTMFHPALTITNIKNLIPITFEMEKSQYYSWAELFKIHCRAYEVIDHIIPKPAASSSTKKDKETSIIITPETWSRLDSIVQWIYNTISNDLLHTILAPDSIAQQAWDRLKSIFHDNKHSRALYLEQQFTNLRLDSFSNISAYYQELKVLADQLSNAGSPVSNDRLVLQLVAGLNESYDSVASHLQHTDPLLQFYEARSRLILEETRKQKQAATNATTVRSALLTTTSVNNSKSNQSGSSHHSRNTPGYGSFININNTRGVVVVVTPMFEVVVDVVESWTPPPCLYPTSNWVWPTTQNGQAGILGPRSQQAHTTTYSPTVASTMGYAPTDIDTTMHTMMLNHPDENWYLDTGATSHITTSPGTLLPYINLSTSKNIIVGNGNGIPVHGFGNTIIQNPYRPLYLNNVLYAPKLIKNLISVRRISIDNNISLEFDPFGFTVKEFSKGTPLMRCNGSGDLYPLSTTMICHHTSPSTFAALSQDLWHHRLGRPGARILNSLKNKRYIQCNQTSRTSVCQSCVFGKQIKMPFYDSSSSTLLPFDIIHSDL
nr:hypothetical protein [Tanacetum cinerariifolium]